MRLKTIIAGFFYDFNFLSYIYGNTYEYMHGLTTTCSD